MKQGHNVDLNKLGSDLRHAYKRLKEIGVSDRKTLELFALERWKFIRGNFLMSSYAGLSYRISIENDIILVNFRKSTESVNNYRPVSGATGTVNKIDIYETLGALTSRFNSLIDLYESINLVNQDDSDVESIVNKFCGINTWRILLSRLQFHVAPGECHTYDNRLRRIAHSVLKELWERRSGLTWIG